MQRVNIWLLEGGKAEELTPNSRMEDERYLEDTLVGNPGLLGKGITLVGRQQRTEGGTLDLLGVDSDGSLVVFELKRGSVTRDAVTQVIDYASSLDNMDFSTLSDHISENSGKGGIDRVEDFERWYSDEFDEDSLHLLTPPRMVLVGVGVDDTAERMVHFLTEYGELDISLLTFHAFDFEGRSLLAKQVEVEERSGDSGPRRSRKPYPGRSERQQMLDERIDTRGVRELYEALRGMFLDNWQRANVVPGKASLRISLPDAQTKGGYRAYARIDPRDDGILLVFYDRTVELDRQAFQLAQESIESEIRRGEVNILLTMGDWAMHEESLVELVQNIYAAWAKSDANS